MRSVFKKAWEFGWFPHFRILWWPPAYLIVLIGRLSLTFQGSYSRWFTAFGKHEGCGMFNCHLGPFGIDWILKSRK